MSIVYDSKKIIPAPFISISKEYSKTENGDIIGVLYTITIQGKFLAYKGSPDSAGTFWTAGGYPPDETIAENAHFTSILKKQEALRGLFDTDGLLLEITPWDGSAPYKCNPRVVSINFPSALWYNVCDYEIVLQADKMIGIIYPNGEDSFAQYLSNAGEEWSIEPSAEAENEHQHQTYRLTHTLNAVGKKHYTVTGAVHDEAWQQAKSWVQSRLGLDTARVTASGNINLSPYFTGYNHSRIESANKQVGGYSATESWVISSGNALEDFTVTTQQSLDNGLTSVNIGGSIQGLESRNSTHQITTSKWLAASGKFDSVSSMIITRAQRYSGLNLNIVPRSYSIARNPVGGNISYNYEYDNRASNIITNARSEIITITERGGGDAFAEIPVLGRALGPVLQSLNTKPEAQVRELNIELLMPASNGSDYTTWWADKPSVSGIVSSVVPVANQVFASPAVETWNPKTGQYSYQRGWTYQ